MARSRALWALALVALVASLLCVHAVRVLDDEPTSAEPSPIPRKSEAEKAMEVKEVLKPKNCNVDSPMLIKPVSDKDVQQICYGAGHSLVLFGNGTVSSWGKGGSGQLGHRNFDDVAVPKPVRSLSHYTITEIACGGGFSLARTFEGVMFAWGANARGQLGLGHTYAVATPTVIKFLQRNVGKIDKMFAGAEHAGVLTLQGQVWTWGGNTYGQLGLGDTDDRDLPRRVEELSLPIKLMAMGAWHNVVVTYRNEVLTWGRGDEGQLGNNAVDNANVPVAVYWETTNPIRHVCAGCEHTVFTQKEYMRKQEHNWVPEEYSSVVAFGNGFFGQLGIDLNRTDDKPEGHDAAVAARKADVKEIERKTKAFMKARDKPGAEKDDSPDVRDGRGTRIGEDVLFTTKYMDDVWTQFWFLEKRNEDASPSVGLYNKLQPVTVRELIKGAKPKESPAKPDARGEYTRNMKQVVDMSCGCHHTTFVMKQPGPDKGAMGAESEKMEVWAFGSNIFGEVGNGQEQKAVGLSGKWECKEGFAEMDKQLGMAGGKRDKKKGPVFKTEDKPVKVDAFDDVPKESQPQLLAKGHSWGHMGVITTTKDVYMWGSNAFNEIPICKGKPAPSPSPPPRPKPVDPVPGPPVFPSPTPCATKDRVYVNERDWKRANAPGWQIHSPTPPPPPAKRVAPPKRPVEAPAPSPVRKCPPPKEKSLSWEIDEEGHFRDTTPDDGEEEDEDEDAED